MIAELSESLAEYKRLLKRREAILAGDCPECGSTFENHNLEDEEIKIAEAKETLDFLAEDYAVIEENNKIARRRKDLEKTVNPIAEFTIDDSNKLDNLAWYVPAKRDCVEIQSLLNIMTRQKVEEEIDSFELERKIYETEGLINEYRQCVTALLKLPKKSKLPTGQLEMLKAKTTNEMHNKQEKYTDLAEEIGRLRTSNGHYTKIKSQLETIKIQLVELETLTKQEFYWTKLSDAYGPKGLRVIQLQKMMDLIIKRLPVYTSLLFNEKGLKFRHNCDGTSIEILACRSEIENGEIHEFEHDISSFSGSEKDQIFLSWMRSIPN